MMIQAILIDDEKHALEMLEWQLQQVCPQVQLLASCLSADEGIAAIRKFRPSLIFLDIEMPHRNGFDLIREFPDPSFDIVFTTAYNQFAIEAFKVAALDYLLKPIDPDDLARTVARFEKKRTQMQLKDQLSVLLHEFQTGLKRNTPNRIALPTSEGIFFADPAEITRCEAKGNYTLVYFRDSKKILLAKTLKEIEELLYSYSFVRIHQSHLVNTSFISKYSKTDGGSIHMMDNTILPVSRQRKEEIGRLFSGSH